MFIKNIKTLKDTSLTAQQPPLFVSVVTYELSGNNAELYSRIQELETQNANLTRDNKNLADQLCNLTQAYNVSESNNKDLSAGVQELNKLNLELETQKKNLTQKIQDMTTNSNELNVSRAQWSIASYCLGNTGMFRSYILGHNYNMFLL